MAIGLMVAERTVWGRKCKQTVIQFATISELTVFHTSNIHFLYVHVVKPHTNSDDRVVIGVC
jgi:hypothetical protein